jgi:hypothetical protein
MLRLADAAQIGVQPGMEMKIRCSRPWGASRPCSIVELRVTFRGYYCSAGLPKAYGRAIQNTRYLRHRFRSMRCKRTQTPQNAARCQNS